MSLIGSGGDFGGDFSAPDSSVSDFTSANQSGNALSSLASSATQLVGTYFATQALEHASDNALKASQTKLPGGLTTGSLLIIGVIVVAIFAMKGK